MKHRNVIIDTDPGIDDAMGIMMALEAHLKGQITIVAFTLARGNCSVANGIKNISAVLSFYPECLEVSKLCLMAPYHENIIAIARWGYEAI